MTKYYIYLSIVIICALFYLYSRLLNPTEQFSEKKIITNKKIIFTVTTFLDFNKEDKWLALCNGIDSILKHHPGIDSFIDFYIINEYSPNPKEDWAQKIKEKYSFINFVQKNKELKGQGESLNLILDLIKTYTYWIHWEEAWYCERPFIFEAIQIMDNTKISQLQFTKELNHTHWEDKVDMKYCHRMPNDNNYCIIYYNIDDYPKIDLKKKFSHEDWMSVKWPLYSIRPSINRVKDYNFGKFLIKPEYWPLKFEIDFGERWMRNKNTKAIFLEGSVTRKPTHVSTYH
jgi:hypothetical protein